MSDRTSDERLTDLEVRYTYLERVVRELDQVIIELRAEVARLTREVKDLGSLAEEDGEGPVPADDPPPHY